MISIKASCIDSTLSPEVVFASEIEKLKEQKFKPVERISLEPYERDHIVVSGWYHQVLIKFNVKLPNFV